MKPTPPGLEALRIMGLLARELTDIIITQDLEIRALIATRDELMEEVNKTRTP